MSVGVVIVTHGTTGEHLLEVAEFIVGQSLAEFRFVPFSQSANHVTTASELQAAMAAADSGDGLLVLTDLIGASPSNLVAELLGARNAVMVTGLNLAMLICVWNYRDQPLGLMARKAVDGGRKGIKIFQE